VSFFMNRFRKLGFIEYNGRIKVHKSLLNAVLLDQLPKLSPEKLPSSAAARTRLNSATFDKRVQD
jgi:CRP/FNR family cyclic AMP-dependent transcriptional regulator